MDINQKKTKAMLINYTRNYQFSTRLTLKGEPIEFVNKMKILGLTVTSDLNWNENTRITIRKVHQRMQLLRSVWSFGSNISEMVHLWKLYCLSVLEQSCVVWGSSISEENKEDLERTQKSFAKLVLGDKFIDYPSALIKLNLETLSKRRDTLMIKFAKSSIINRKLHTFFPKRTVGTEMKTQNRDTYQITRANTERFKSSSILYMQRLLNQNEDK